MSYNIFDKFANYANIVEYEDFKNVIQDLGDKFEDRKEAVTQVGVVFSDHTYYHSDNTYCHAGLNLPQRIKEDKKKQPYYIVSSVQKSHEFMTKEDEKRFIKYLVSESMYSDAFIDKDAAEIQNKGYYTINANMPSNICCGAAMCTRFISETHNKYGAKVFTSLVNEDWIEPNHLFAFSHVFGSSGTNKLLPIVASSRDTHNGYRLSNAKLSSIKNFVNNNRVNKNDNYVKTKSYSKVAALWGNDDLYAGINENNSFYSYCKNLSKHVFVDDVTFNVFALNKKRKPDQNGNTYITDEKSLKYVYQKFTEDVAAA